MSLLFNSSQGYFFESIMEKDSFACKKMFGSVALYLHGKMVACLCEGEEHSWRGVDYGFNIWNGVLIPSNYDDHLSLKDELTGTIQHPVLKKWLYLPMDSAEYEETLWKLVALIEKNDERVGIYPNVRKSKKSQIQKKKKAKSSRIKQRLDPKKAKKRKPN